MSPDRPASLHLVLALAALLLPLACATRPAPHGPSWTRAAGRTADPSLAELCREAWEEMLASDPVFASRQGDSRYHGQLADRSPGGLRARVSAKESLLRRARELQTDELDDEDRLTHRWLVEHLEKELSVARLGTWVVDPLRGPQSSLLSLAEFQPLETRREREQLVERWQAMARAIRTHAENLRRGRRVGRVSSRTAVEKTLVQLDELLATPAKDSPLTEPALGGGRWIPLARGETVSAVAHEHLGSASRQHELRLVNLHLQDGAALALGTRVLLPGPEDPLPPRERGEFLRDVLAVVESEIYPAYDHLRGVLREEILPAARSDEEPGLVHVPGGREAYRARIRQHTSLDLSPEEIHQFGLDEIARIRAEISSLGERLLSTSDLAEIQARLRDDPAMHFTTREEVEAKARNAFERASLALPQWFGLLPEADCVVQRIPEHEERYSTVAYYRPPAADGSRPGIYFVNTYAPETRTVYEAEVLAYHEAVPGHHLQIAIAQELDSLPLVRRHAASTAFVEGWALYTERLCDEMGLYTSNLDRIGMLSYDAWRASRLVVDTGMHAFGWSRARAIEYMMENTLLAANNIENEVDRYIAWPGQALAYKLGQRRILELRDSAREELGERFDLAQFHDRVLENGGVTLPILTERIEAWIEGRRAEG